MKEFVKFLGQHNKAIASFFGYGVLTWLAVRSGGVTNSEWSEILTAACLGAGLTWAVPNVGKKP